MSRLKVLGVAAALGVGGSIATAQITVSNIFGNLYKVIPDGHTTGMSDTENLTFSGPGLASRTGFQVTLTIANGYNGDFCASLAHDNGFSVLLNRPGRTAANSAGYGDAGVGVTFSASGDDIRRYQSFFPSFIGDQVTGTGAPDSGYVDPEAVVDTVPQTSLFGSSNGPDPSGAWTLFLADLDYGQQGDLVQWGVVISGIPEPSTWTLMGLGGFAVGVRFLRRGQSR